MNQLELASKLAKDEKFRKQAINAVAQATMIRRRTKLAAYEQLRSELRELTKNIQRAVTRAEKKSSHKLRNTLSSSAPARRRCGPAGPPTRPRALLERPEHERDDAAHDRRDDRGQRPGLDGVQPVDAVRGLPALHGRRRPRAAARRHAPALGRKIGGKTNEWDAKILEQHPDKQISWISEDGKKTRGTVTFEPIGDDGKTRITPLDELPGGAARETLGSAAGLDQRSACAATWSGSRN